MARVAQLIHENVTETTAVGINSTEYNVVCYAPRMITAIGLWNHDNPLDYALPILLIQMMLIVVATRVLVFFLRPLQQPRVVSEILVSVACIQIFPLYYSLCIS